MNEPIPKQFIYSVMMKVIPTPRHPLYYEIQYGVMTVWLWDDTSESAVTRAEDILKLIGYEIQGEMRGFKRHEDTATLPPRFQEQITSVMQNGFATNFIAAAIGVEDSDFDKMIEEWLR